MTSKELFCLIVEKARKQNDAICNLESALGAIIDDENLFGIFNKSDKICGFLVWGEKEIPKWFYELYWDLVLDGEIVLYAETNDKIIINTAERFYDFLNE